MCISCTLQKIGFCYLTEFFVNFQNLSTLGGSGTGIEMIIEDVIKWCDRSVYILGLLAIIGSVRIQCVILENLYIYFTKPHTHCEH